MISKTNVLSSMRRSSNTDRVKINIHDKGMTITTVSGESAELSVDGMFKLFSAMWEGLTSQEELQEDLVNWLEIQLEMMVGWEDIK